MKFVQLVLTDEQTGWVATALRDYAPEPGAMEEEAQKQIGRLVLLFSDAYETPSKYPVTGKMANTVRSIVRRAKGPAQTPKRVSPRADRRQGRQKLERKLRRQIAESYNAAREAIEAEMKEAEEYRAEAEARIATQPKYSVLDGQGNVLLSGIPAEFVQAEETGENLLPKIIVPGS